MKESITLVHVWRNVCPGVTFGKNHNDVRRRRAGEQQSRQASPPEALTPPKCDASTTSTPFTVNSIARRYPAVTFFMRRPTNQPSAPIVVAVQFPRFCGRTRGVKQTIFVGFGFSLRRVPRRLARTQQASGLERGSSLRYQVEEPAYAWKSRNG
jgi:hypothetical protein